MNSYAPGDAPQNRCLTLTAKGRCALAYGERVVPQDLFTREQWAALAAAGFSVWFVRADRLLGEAT